LRFFDMLDLYSHLSQARTFELDPPTGLFTSYIYNWLLLIRL
jgi:hypothetical protein